MSTLNDELKVTKRINAALEQFPYETKMRILQFVENSIATTERHRFEVAHKTALVGRPMDAVPGCVTDAVRS